MPLQALKTVAQSQNGVGAFILQCKSLEFFFCSKGGSSRGMVSFLKHSLHRFAQQHPGIEIKVAPRPCRHPIVRGRYINGREKAVCVRNLEKDEVMQKVLLLRSASGEKLRRQTKPVKSLNESVRGIWDPFHGHDYKV